MILGQLAAKVAKLANTTHKDRVNEFNSKLEALSEHHDIPKVRHSLLIFAKSNTYLSIFIRLDPDKTLFPRPPHVLLFLSLVALCNCAAVGADC